MAKKKPAKKAGPKIKAVTKASAKPATPRKAAPKPFKPIGPEARRLVAESRLKLEHDDGGTHRGVTVRRISKGTINPGGGLPITKKKFRATVKRQNGDTAFVDGDSWSEITHNIDQFLDQK